MNKIWIIIAFVILFPILAYTYRFGIGLWDDHTKWAELGSFMGGVIGPLLTLATVLFLYIQLKEQQKQQEKALFLIRSQKFEVDIAFFTAIIVKELGKKLPACDDKTLKEKIDSFISEVNYVFMNCKNKEKILKESSSEAHCFLLSHDSVINGWFAINRALHQLRNLDSITELHDFDSQMARVYFQLGHMCSHLDTIQMLLDFNYIPIFRKSFEETLVDNN